MNAMSQVAARLLRACLLLLFLFGYSGVVEAAGSVVCTTNAGQYVNVYTCVWTSSAGGAVSSNAFTVTPGALIQVKFKPAASGSQPSDLYDVTLVDADGWDQLGGSGADRSNSAISILLANPPITLTSSQTLDIVVANAGNAKSGTVILVIDHSYWRR